MYCKGECQQGRKPCPTPQACCLPEIEDSTGVDWAYVGVTIVILLCVAAGLGYVIASAQ